MTRARKARGFTIIEMVIALSLGTMVLVAVNSLYMPLMRTQFDAYRRGGAQAEALIAHKSLRLSISQATEIYLPAPSAGGDLLSGCSNFDSAKGAGVQGLLDPDGPSRSFYFCVEGGILYEYWAEASCPMFYPPCGGATAGYRALARRISHAPGFPAYFVRPAAAPNVVELHYQAEGRGVSQIVATAVAYEGAPR